MKITVKPKQKEKHENIPFDEIPVGYVYIAKYSNGPIALKLEDNEAVLLKYSNNSDWFEMAHGSKGQPAYEVLGKLTEIIVKEV